MHPFRERDERAWNGRVSAEYGCTVTFENAGGQSLVMARRGPPTDCLHAMCAAAVAVDPTFRVVSYSTPETIRYDLRGRYSPAQKGRTLAVQATPEGGALSRVNLLHMLHPRLQGEHHDAQEKHRAAARRAGL